MTYRIIYSETLTVPATSTEEFSQEHEALGRARQLLETGEQHSVAIDDGSRQHATRGAAAAEIGRVFGRLKLPRSPE
jgi:hypothetical protein